MSILDTIRHIKVPAPKQIIEIPDKIRETSKNNNINTINVRYFDRFFKRCNTVKGTISRNTSIPIIYFNSPQKLAGIVFDDSTYLDENNQLWIDFCEDYPYALNYNTELIEFLKVQYYNDFAADKIEIMRNDADCYKNYLIPVLLNRIPREVIKINTRQRLRLVDENFVKNKIEITQNLIRQFGDIIMFSRVGKKDNSFIITGVLIGMSIGIIIGIFSAVAFIK